MPSTGSFGTAEEATYVISATDVTQEAINSAKANLKDLTRTTEKTTAAIDDYWKRLEANMRRVSVSPQVQGVPWQQFGLGNMAQAVEAQSAKIKAVQADILAGERRTAAEREAMWGRLGVRSTAAIEAEKRAVIASYDSIRGTVQRGSQDWINIERAKNERLKQLNREMVGDHERSIASMTNAVLRYAAGLYVVQMAGRAVWAVFGGGVEAIDSLKTSTIAVAAQLTSMQGTSGNIVENYRQNLVYAEAINRKLMEIDASSFANLEQIQLMNRAMINQGVVLDVNNAKQVESFTALTNAVALLTTGQDKTKQASQEIRALMSGQVKATDMVAQQIDALIRKAGEYKDGLKGLVEEGKKHGDTLERLQPYLVGIVAASGDISKTWGAVNSSLQTAWNILQRDVFKDFYRSLVEGGQRAAAWTKANAAEIGNALRQAYDTAAFAIKATIGALALFSAAAWLHAGKAADAAAWFALRWEVMTARVTFSTSKMALAFSTFTAGILGFSIGEYLSNNFEWARRAGVAMVYGILDAWSWLELKMKTGWERLKAMAMAATPAPGVNQAEIFKEADARIAALNAGYEKERRLRAQFRDEQFGDVTDAAIAQAKARAEAAAKVGVPDIPPGAGGEGIDSAKKTIQNKLAELDAIITESPIADDFERKLEEINNKAKQWRLDLKGVAGADQKINDAVKALIDKAATEAAMKDFDDYLKRQDEQTKQAVQRANEQIREGSRALREETEERIASWEYMAKRAKEIEDGMLASERESQRARVALYEEAWAQISALSGGEGEQHSMNAMKGIADIYAGTDIWSREADAAYSHYQDMQELYWKDYETRKEVQQAYNQYLIASDRAVSNQRLTIAANSWGAIAGFAQAMYVVTGEKHRAYFEVWKAASIAETVINTYKAAVGAYSAMASIPYVGPALGAAAAAAAVAYGMAQVARIRAMKFGGGSEGGGGGGGGSHKTSMPDSSSVTPVSAPVATPAERPIVVNVTINSAILGSDKTAVARELAPEIAKAVKAGVH